MIAALQKSQRMKKQTHPGVAPGQPPKNVESSTGQTDWIKYRTWSYKKIRKKKKSICTREKDQRKGGELGAASSAFLTMHLAIFFLSASLEIADRVESAHSSLKATFMDMSTELCSSCYQFDSSLTRARRVHSLPKQPAFRLSMQSERLIEP